MRAFLLGGDPHHHARKSPGRDHGGMDTNTAPTIDDLLSLTLADGLTLTSSGRPIVYRLVRLRETSVADERAATRMAERVVTVGGVPQLLVSDAEYRYAMTLRHIEHLECDGQRLGSALLDLDMLGRLTSHDLNLIEQRVFLIEMAAQVRYGVITPEDFAALAAGTRSKAPGAPQPGGQAEGVGSTPAAAEPVPAMLADFAGDAAHGQAASHGQ